jgi:hypothetical protein
MYIYIYTSLQQNICGWFTLVLPGAARATERIPCFFRAWARIDLAPCVGFVAVSTAVVFLTVFKNWDGWLERVGTQCFHTHTYVHIHMHIPAYTVFFNVSIYIYTYYHMYIVLLQSHVCRQLLPKRSNWEGTMQNSEDQRSAAHPATLGPWQHELWIPGWLWYVPIDNNI